MNYKRNADSGKNSQGRSKSKLWTTSWFQLWTGAEWQAPGAIVCINPKVEMEGSKACPVRNRKDCGNLCEGLKVWHKDASI